MRVQGLDGQEYIWMLTDHIHRGSNKRPRSQYHVRARKLLLALFPAYPLLEELYLPGTDGLYADFYLSTCRTMVEVHGRQHYEFVPHFHKTRLGFLQHQQRDRKKSQWCELNEIGLVELPYSETNNEWTERILAGVV